MDTLLHCNVLVCPLNSITVKIRLLFRKSEMETDASLKNCLKAQSKEKLADRNQASSYPRSRSDDSLLQASASTRPRCLESPRDTEAENSGRLDPPAVQRRARSREKRVNKEREKINEEYDRKLRERNFCLQSLKIFFYLLVYIFLDHKIVIIL